MSVTMAGAFFLISFLGMMPNVAAEVETKSDCYQPGNLVCAAVTAGAIVTCVRDLSIGVCQGKSVHSIAGSSEPYGFRGRAFYTGYGCGDKYDNGCGVNLDGSRECEFGSLYYDDQANPASSSANNPEVNGPVCQRGTEHDQGENTGLGVECYYVRSMTIGGAYLHSAQNIEADPDTADIDEFKCAP